MGRHLVRLRPVLILAALSLSPAAFGQGTPVPEQVPFPRGYREWVHVKSMIIYSDQHPLFGAFAGIHHVYANPKAVSAMKSGKPFADGSVLVFDLKEARRVGGTYAEGKRVFIAVMHRDAKRFAATEGWGWEIFEAGDRDRRQVRTLIEAKACSTCHKEVGARGFTFSDLRN